MDNFDLKKAIQEAKAKNYTEQHQPQNEAVYSLLILVEATGWNLSDINAKRKAGQINVIGCDIRQNRHTGELIYFGGSITETELKRLTDLARSQQSKPTYEQLEADIIELKAINERLHDKLKSNPTETTEHPNSLNKSKAIIQALYHLANKPSHKQIINKAEELGYTVSSDTITNRLK